MGMQYRKLGRTNFEVSDIGYGAWGIGGKQWLGGADDESLLALRRSIDFRGARFLRNLLQLCELSRLLRTPDVRTSWRGIRPNVPRCRLRSVAA